MSGIRPGPGGGAGGASSVAAADIVSAIEGDSGAAADLATALGVSADPGMPSTNLVALWRASSLSLANGDPIATWAPAVGSPGSPTGSGSGRPTYLSAGSPAGGPCAAFDGSDDEMTLSSPVGLPSGAAAGTLVAIISRAFHNGSISLVAQYGAGGTAQCRGVGLNATQWYLYDYASDIHADSDYDGGRHPRGVVLTHWYDGTTRKLVVDGTPVKSSTTTLNTGSSALHLGRSVYGGERASFRLMELAIYSTALSDAALAQIQAHARIAHGVT